MTRTQLLSDALGTPEYVSAMERAASAFPQYRSRLPIIPYAYTRTRLIDMPHFEVVVMLWTAGSVSPVHDHGDSRCWVLMLEGALDVENFDRHDDGNGDRVDLRAAGSLKLRAGDVDSRNGPRELHRVVNPGPESAYSLQLYAAPIANYNVIDERALTTRAVAATCDLELDLNSLSA